MSSLPPLVNPGPTLGSEGYHRYSRQMLLPELEVQGQRRLHASRVLVLGAGGLGAPVIQYLAAVGVGHLTIVDDDVVEISNLHRQVIHSVADVGSPKVDSAARAVHALNPEVEVTTHRLRLDTDTADRMLAGQDLVVDGTDNFPTRYLVSDTCAHLGTPVVWGSVLGFDAQVSVFWDSPPAGHEERARTLRDLFPHPPAPGMVPSCSEAGVVGALCGQVGSIMAMEAVKLITGTGDPLLGRVLVIDALAPSTTTLDFARTEGRPAGSFPVTRSDTSIARACVAAPPGSDDPGTVDVGQLLGILEREPDTLLLDVREEDERRAGAIPDSLWVPLGELLDGAGLAELPPGRNIIVYCHAGIRSAVARDLLEASGWAGTRHLAGGIRAWEAAGLMTPSPRVQRG